MTDHHCPTCGTPVRVVGTREGTMHYEPDHSAIAREFVNRVDARAATRWTNKPLSGRLNALEWAFTEEVAAMEEGEDGD